MEKIFYKDVLVGILITSMPDGSVPLTDGGEPLQMVALKHPKGAYLKAHAHAPRERVTQSLQEALIVKKGRVSIDLYAKEESGFIKFKTVELAVGEVFILMNGGYGINMLEDSELIEVKNGPFLEDKVLI